MFSKLPWLWRVWPRECLQSPGEGWWAGSERCPGESKHGSQEVSISMGTEFRKEVRIICTCSVFISLVDSCEMFQVDH